MEYRTEDVWATPHVAGKNVVRQLLVPACDDVEVLETEPGIEVVKTPFGQWPTTRAADLPTDGPLAARLPGLHSPNAHLEWGGSRAADQASKVIQSFEGAIGFTAHDLPRSLRRPQIAALHSIVGYQSSGLSEPGIVVMPTGTGKTETMLAWLVAQRPERVLVVVPSTALRDQIASKFETLGILQIEGIVDHRALRLRVGRVEGRFTDDAEARAFVEAANVVVATPNAVDANDPDVRAAFVERFTHLLVDEAHHAPARTWTEIIRVFANRPTLLFTATPFRRDGLILPGRLIFRFPLREAQKGGYFSTIDFTAVLDLDDDDEALALAAVSRLREDLAAGHEHLLLARVGSKARADEVHALYSRIAPELTPKVIYDSMSARRRAETLKAMRDRTSRVIVCVDMLGEGFDLPTLKVGAFHDAHRSLSPMVQLIGRLARTSSPLPIGRASVYVRQEPRHALSPMRFLLREAASFVLALSVGVRRPPARVSRTARVAAVS